MIQAFICLVLAVLLRITVEQLSATFDFLTEWIFWANVAIWVFAAVLAMVVILRLLKTVFDGKGK